MSAFKNKVLIGLVYYGYRLLIFNSEGHYLSNITLQNVGTLHYATWTPSGNIIYLTEGDGKIEVISELGKIFTFTQMKEPKFISIYNNAIMYLADTKGVYQSSDDGVSWNLVFSPRDPNLMWVIRVTSEQSDNFWTLKNTIDSTDLTGIDESDPFFLLQDYKRLSSSNIDILRLYNASAVSATNLKSNNATGSIIRLTNPLCKDLQALSAKTLSYDGGKHIFLIEDYTVHVFLLSGQYYCRLLSLYDKNKRPNMLRVDQYSRLLYVVYENEVHVFKLIYN